jgi:hypothetical protein
MKQFSDGDPNMNRSTCIASLFLLVGIALPTAATAQQTTINIQTPTLTLSPSAADYANGYVEATGASGIQVDVKSNSPLGMTLLVRCSGAPQIALSDLLIRTPTSPGLGGASMSTYTPISVVDQQLWRSAIHLLAGPLRVVTDVRVQNLMNYDDTAGGAPTNYTNTLTYTVIAL